MTLAILLPKNKTARARTQRMGNWINLAQAAIKGIKIVWSLPAKRHIIHGSSFESAFYASVTLLHLYHLCKFYKNAPRHYAFNATCCLPAYL